MALKLAPDFISREEQLKWTSHVLFGPVEPSVEKLESYPYPHVMLRFVKVVQTRGASVYFRDGYDPKERFGPVLLPMPYWGQIRRGDIFLVAIGLEDSKWEILYLSPLVQTLP